MVKAVRNPLNLLQLTENLELLKEQTYEAAFRAEVVQKNDCPCILLTGFWICILPEKTYCICVVLNRITFVWFLLSV